MAQPTNLIIVCCHGIWTGGPSAGQEESEWLIADFQRGETPTFAQHARAGIELLLKDSSAALAFSGGPTRAEIEISEAQSYANLAAANSFWGLSDNTPANILMEERALDSYHNILYSLTIFFVTYRSWPTQLTIVSHGFKEPRIVQGHCTAIGYPLDRITFVGINPPGMQHTSDKAHIGVGTAMDEWTQDPHGRGESLAGKRKRRNPWNIWQGIFPEGVSGGGQGHGGLLTAGRGEDEILAPHTIRPWSV